MLDNGREEGEEGCVNAFGFGMIAWLGGKERRDVLLYFTLDKLDRDKDK